MTEKRFKTERFWWMEGTIPLPLNWWNEGFGTTEGKVILEPCSDHYGQVRVMERTVGQLGGRQIKRKEAFWLQRWVAQDELDAWGQLTTP